MPPRHSSCSGFLELKGSSDMPSGVPCKGVDSMAKNQVVRVAAVGDLHCGKASRGAFHTLFNQVAEAADLLVLCGDLTDYGLPEEAEILVKEMAPLAKIPVVGVLGNHDFESGQQAEVREILAHAGVSLLDGESCEIQGIGFAGAKGFAGVWPGHTRGLGRTGDQAVRSGGTRRSGSSSSPRWLV